jgi:hypothetical protein
MFGMKPICQCIHAEPRTLVGCLCARYCWDRPSTGLLVIILTRNSKHMYCSGAIYSTMVQCLLLVFTVFQVLEGPIHGGNELETTNCN